MPYSAAKPLKVLFDANSIAAGGKSGVGYYSAYLLRSLAECYPNDLELVGHYYNFLGRNPVDDLPTAPNIHYRVSRLWPGKATNLLRRFGLQVPFELLIKARGDVLIFPNFLNLPSLFKTPSALTIHDLAFREHPESLSPKNLNDLTRFVPPAIKRAQVILVNSEFTKRSVTSAYSTAGKQLVVTPIPPVNTALVNKLDAQKVVVALGVSKEYLLFLGNLEPRKNLAALLEAYALLPSKLRDRYCLVLAGGSGWKNEALLAQIDALRAAGLTIVTTGYVSDTQKAALYHGASLVVLPSLYEGFGMPILEAFEQGTPVAASDIPILREVAGPAAAYFDPTDVNDIAKVIARCLADDAFRQYIIEGQAQELSKYSWTKNAEAVYKALREVTT